MKEFEVGDKVQIVDTSRLMTCRSIVRSMLEYAGRKTVVTAVYDMRDGKFYRLKDCANYYWGSDALISSDGLVFKC